MSFDYFLDVLLFLSIQCFFFHIKVIPLKFNQDKNRELQLENFNQDKNLELLT